MIFFIVYYLWAIIKFLASKFEQQQQISVNLHMVKIIQNYTIYEQIGQGEYGKVYRGIDTKTNAPVAVKVVHINKFKQNRKLEQCTLNQIEILSKMSCQHIVKFIQILKTANNFYFFYQFCNEGTLQQKIKKMGVIPESTVLTYLAQIIDAFKILTSKNIMHRDLKPGNIFFHNGQIKIGDFGFCKSLQSSKDLAQTMLGSPIYMAPQILKGEIYTIKADIWSLGVLVYQMLYGYCPYQQSSIAKLINLLDKASPTFDKNINNVSPVLEQFVKRMLTKDHFKRIGWEEIFEYRISSEGIFKGGNQIKDNINYNNIFSNTEHANNRQIHVNRHSELRNYKGGSDSVHNSVNQKPRPTSQCASFKRKANKQNMNPINQSLINYHQKLVFCVKAIYDVMRFNYFPEITVPLCQKLLCIVQKQYQKQGLKKRSVLSKQLKHLSDVVNQFQDAQSVCETTSPYILYYVNCLQKSQPRMFFQQSQKSLVIHILALLDFNKIENCRLPAQRQSISKQKLLTELNSKIATNQI